MNSDENVVSRLKQRLQHASSLGFKVRIELLDEEQASWCEIAGVPTLFVDLSQTAAEQLKQVEETLSAYLAAQTARAANPETDTNRRTNADPTQRAA